MTEAASHGTVPHQYHKYQLHIIINPTITFDVTDVEHWMVGRPTSRVQECPSGSQVWSTAEEGAEVFQTEGLGGPLGPAEVEIV